MKAKPNTEQFLPKKDPTAFLAGGATDLADRTPPPAPPPVTIEPVVTVAAMDSKIHREQKIFRLPSDLITTLKRESYERSVKTGTRVTETELVEQALRAYFKN